MATAPNLKVNIGADTKDFEKGAKEVKQGLKDLDKTGNEALSSLGDAFGVNTGKIGQLTSAITGMGQKLSQCGNTGVAAFGNLLKSIGPVGGAIAGLGLGAAIAGFKQLKAEADNFKSTVDGMNMSMATAAYISTYKQVLHDVNSDTGKQVAEAMNQWEKGFGRFKAQLGATFSTFMTSSTLGEFGQSFKELRSAFKEADEAGKRNEARANQIADIKKEELQVRQDIADIDADIAEQRRIIRDRSRSVEERSAAEAELRDKIAQKSAMQTSMAERLYNLQKDMTSEAGSTYDEMKEVADLYVQWKGLSAAEADQLATIDRYSNSIASGTSKAAQAAKEYAESVQKMAAAQAKWSGLGSVSTEGLSSLQGGVSGPSLSILPQRADTELFKQTFLAQLGEIKVGIGFEADTQKIHDITNEVTSLVQSGVSRTAEIIGNLVGTLAAGGDAWGDFKNAALSAFGDMAIAVGKIAVAAGVATLGIKAAFESMNGYAAIAAGAALIALGSAVKASLSAVASGDYSAAGGGYAGGSVGSASSGGYETREVNVNVTGTLVANGDQLITVINNTNKKNYYTQ